MLTDFFVGWFSALFEPLLDLLPEGNLDPTEGGMGSVALWIGQADTLIPIVGPMKLALGLLSAIGAFWTLRMFIFVWRQLPFT